MDPIKTLLVFAASITFLFSKAQNSSEDNEAKNNVTINGLRHATYASIGYSYRIWQNQPQTFRFGLQTGLGYGGQNADWSVPLGIYLEGGKKHRIGVSANIVYQYEVREVRLFFRPTGQNTNVRVVYDNGAFTGELYYLYNFGENNKFNAGLGVNYIGYFGNNYGAEYLVPDEILPFVSFGVRF
jgi:hypothetical protein